MDSARKLLIESLACLGSVDGQEALELRQKIRKFLAPELKEAEQVLGEVLKEIKLVTNVTLMCESCKYIAWRVVGVLDKTVPCPNGHGWLQKQKPEMTEIPLQAYQHRLRKIERDSRIVGVAMIYKDVVYTLPKPYRHCHLIQMICEKLGGEGVHGEEDGFVDQYGTFMRRKPAFYVAERAGQLLHDRPLYPGELYSENVW